MRFGHVDSECKQTGQPHPTHDFSDKPAPQQSIATRMAWASKPPTTTLQNTQEQETFNDMAPPPLLSEPDAAPQASAYDIPPQSSSLPLNIMDDHAILHTVPESSTAGHGHVSDGDDPVQEILPIQAWKDCSASLAAKLVGPSDGFIEVTKKKIRRPHKDYSGQTPFITTRLAAGKIPRASFSRKSR